MPLEVDRVLGGDHQEGAGHRIADGVDGDLAFLHYLQQGRLGLGDARLISSPSTRWANTGPGWNSKRRLRSSQIDTPVMSDGSRSGVNWTRCQAASMDAARVLAMRRLADARHVLDQQVALGEQAAEGLAEHIRLTPDDPFQVGEQRVVPGGEPGGVLGRDALPVGRHRGESALMERSRTPWPGRVSAARRVSVR